MKKKPLLIIVVIVLLLALIAGGAYYFLVLPNQAKESAEPVYYNYELEDSFVTNVKDSKKLFKTSIILVADSEDLTDTIKADTPIIRDTILFMLRNLTEDEICSDTIQEKLRKEIPEALNKALGIDNIVSIYFGDFVMQ